jgi:hypothetical protein
MLQASVTAADDAFLTSWGNGIRCLVMIAKFAIHFDLFALAQ